MGSQGNQLIRKMDEAFNKSEEKAKEKFNRPSNLKYFTKKIYFF